jgi:hypothetical protein
MPSLFHFIKIQHVESYVFMNYITSVLLLSAPSFVTSARRRHRMNTLSESIIIGLLHFDPFSVVITYYYVVASLILHSWYLSEGLACSRLGFLEIGGQ